MEMGTNILDENKFIVINDDGTQTECEALFRFESDETHKNYIVYTDNTTDEDGNIQVFAAIYTPGSDTTKLEPIETEAEWDKIQEILDAIQEEVLNASEEDDDEDGEE